MREVVLKKRHPGLLWVKKRNSLTNHYGNYYKGHSFLLDFFSSKQGKKLLDCF